MATIGQDLKKERELRSITVMDIADKTKISPRLLRALEDDRWNDLPGPFFVKGVIRAYAGAVGADDAAYLRRYLDEIGVYEVDASRELQIRKEANFLAERLPRRIPWRTAGAVVLAAAVITTVFLLIRAPRPRPAEAPPASADVKLPAPPPAAPIEAGGFGTAPSAATSAEAGLVLALSFRAETWIHAAADGRVVLEGIRLEGDKVSLRAEREFVLQLGNAGGLEFTINGRPTRPLGGSGIVLTDIRINRDNYASFLKEEAAGAGPGR